MGYGLTGRDAAACVSTCLTVRRLPLGRAAGHLLDLALLFAARVRTRLFGQLLLARRPFRVLPLFLPHCFAIRHEPPSHNINCRSPSTRVHPHSSPLTT